MLTIPHTRVADNLKREHSIVVLALDQAQDGELFDVALQRELVLAGREEKVRNESVANRRAIHREVHGDIAQVEGHNRGVGNADVGNEVGAVGQDLVLAGENANVGYVEPGKLV